MEKREYKNKINIMLVLMALYLIAVVNGSQLWGNIISPITAFASGYMIWTTSRKINEYGLNWTVLAMMAFSWSFTDTMWMAASEIYGLDPEEMPIFMYLYLIPNLLLTLAAIMYFYKNIKRWYTVQSVLDLGTALIIAFILTWKSILKDYNFLLISYDDIIGTFLYLLTDILSISIVIVMFLHMKSQKLSKALNLLISGVCLYTISDIYYTYLVFTDAYVPNSFIDYIYMSAIVIFSIACLQEAYEPTIIDKSTYTVVPEKIGGSNKNILLLLLPIMIYLTGKFSVVVLWQITIIVVFYEVLSSFVQVNIRKEYLLKKEKLMNEKLEEIISERTKDLVRANKALDELAKLDTLTGLYNRRYFLEEIEMAISTENNKFSILYMDLDRFKTINDTHGHDMGDQILKEISKRLNACRKEFEFAEDALIARLGGDEFSVALKGEIGQDRLEALCRELIKDINKPIVIDQYVFNVGVSIGVSRYPLDAGEREQLMKYADIAMYHAKKGYGGKRYALYNQSQSAIIHKRNEIEILLRNANFDKEFELDFQPQFRIKDNKLIGVEALLRWNSPVRGRISPLEFIPIAEETGIILDIGNWVMEKAIRQVGLWNEKHHLSLVMGINISPRQIDSVDFLPDIKKLIESMEFNPRCIDLEITENSAMNTNITMEEILTELSNMGINISIDDFGTGYSSLSYIKRFDIDRLKIAKELVENISSDRNDMLIVKAIIMMAKGLGLKTIAEGVETEEQLKLLRMLGCDEVQGYLLSKPITAEVFEDRFLVHEIAVAQNE